MQKIVYIIRSTKVTKYPLLKEGLKISEDLKYNEFPETFLKLHTKGYLYPKYYDGLSLVPKFDFLRDKLLDYITNFPKHLIHENQLRKMPKLQNQFHIYQICETQLLSIPLKLSYECGILTEFDSKLREQLKSCCSTIFSTPQLHAMPRSYGKP